MVKPSKEQNGYDYVQILPFMIMFRFCPLTCTAHILAMPMNDRKHYSSFFTNLLTKIITTITTAAAAVTQKHWEINHLP